MSVALLTCVTNFGGVGPGHSCLSINGTVYTFENQGGIGDGSVSGWRIVGHASYMRENTHRPVIVQTLKGAVNASKTLQYIVRSIRRDDDYGGSGVCSSQAASAIEAGWGQTFNTLGLDKPYDIYDLAKSKGLVHTERMYWPGEDDCNFMVRTAIKMVLKEIEWGLGAIAF